MSSTVRGAWHRPRHGRSPDGPVPLAESHAAGDVAAFGGCDANGKLAERTDQTIYEDLQSLIHAERASRIMLI